jgi:hypothetical protein
MSIAEILIEVEKLNAAERAKLIKVLHETEAQDNQQTAEDEKPFKTIFDVAPHLVGAVDSGITDLGSNKKHLEGYGTKAAEREGLSKSDQDGNR